MVNTITSSGTLYVTATPIGNLGDITFRAIEVLKNADYVLCEDFRTSKKLLNHFKIETYLLTYRDETRHKITPQVISDLKLGKNIALISDNGTPLISDPGFKLVEEARKNELNVVAVPGPSAVTSALSISGIPTDNFTFLGFLPKKGGQRISTIKDFGGLETTLVFYESPHRILRLIDDIIKILGDRRAFLAREMTKVHETGYLGRLSEISHELEKRPIKGELVLLVAKENF